MSDILAVIAGIASAVKVAVTGEQTLALPPATTPQQLEEQQDVRRQHAAAINGDADAFPTLQRYQSAGGSKGQFAEIAIVDLMTRGIVSDLGAKGAVVSSRVNPLGIARQAFIGLGLFAVAFFVILIKRRK